MRLLLIEDETGIVDFVKSGLESKGYLVDFSLDGEEGAFLALTNDYDLVIIDNMLPKKSGLEICTELRRAGKTMPILVLSVIAEPKKKVALLNAGADDYLTKPFSFEELAARVRALLRRPRTIEPKKTTLELDDLVVDLTAHTVTRGGSRLRLNPKEYSLLVHLLNNQGAVVSRAMLMEHVWGMETDPFTNTIEAHILSLRRKIDAEGHHKLIHTIHGVGYKIDVIP